MLCLAALANAQDDNRGRVQLGFKAGINNSNIYDTHGQDIAANALWGPVIGGWLSLPVGDYLGLQPEVLYSEKGFSGTGTAPEGQYSFTDRLDFLDIPVLVQFKPVPCLYLLGGPEYSYLLSRTYTFMNGVTSTTTQQAFDNDNLRHNVFGLIFGFDINLNHITLGARVAWDLQDNNGNGTSSLPRYRNIWGQVTLGFRL